MKLVIIANLCVLLIFGTLASNAMMNDVSHKGHFETNSVQIWHSRLSHIQKPLTLITMPDRRISSYETAPSGAMCDEAGKKESLQSLKGAPMARFDDLPTEKKNELKLAREATFSIQKPTGCTGTFISNDGHFITAHHCIKRCLRFGADWQQYLRHTSYKDANFPAHGGRAMSPHGSQPEYFTLREWMVEKIQEKIVCHIAINGRQQEEAKLIALGKGELWPYFRSQLRSPMLNEQYKSLTKLGFGGASDFAILQLKSHRRTNCLNFASQRPVINEAVHTLSFPRSDPSEVENFGGKTLIYSSGKNIQVLALSEPCFLGKQDLDEGTFLTSLEVNSQSSGSSVLNKHNEIVGITAAALTQTDPSSGEILLVTARIVAIEQIKAQAAEALKNISCDDSY